MLNIQIGGGINIVLKTNKLKFGKCNRSGKAEKDLVIALLSPKYGNDEHAIIYHILTSKGRKSINTKNLKGIGEIVHNYQNSSKENSDFVVQFINLSPTDRENVLNKINLRNKKRDEDCKAYNVECSDHRELVDIGVKQLEKLQRIHDLKMLNSQSKLHMWIDPTRKFSQKQKNRLSKKEKKELKKQHAKQRKSKKKNN